MKENSAIRSVRFLCILVLLAVSFALCPAVARAQVDWGTQPAKPAKQAAPAYTPPPDRMIYFKCGPREKTVAVAAVNVNVPGLPPELNYLKSTDEALGDNGYDLCDMSARHAIDVRVNAKYNEVDNSKAVAHQAGAKVATGAVLGVLGALASGGGGRDVGQGAAGGAAYGLADATATPTSPVTRYVTLEFEISSKAGGLQTGQVTKDISDPSLRLEEFLDGAIADYLEASLPKRR